MSYLVLARKYRPRNFEQMVGQSHVVQALANALVQQRLHHAYLFTGTRGVGKTTVSRILAKSLNCTGPDGQGDITAQPCGQCQACCDIDAGRFVDYVELDAASNRGVEEISQLLDQAVYKPVVGRFKVYMIDEVHMLSNTAFNAMLKTLEEPPEYLKFVLATTDPQKVPVTVLSRCLQFNLRPMAAQTVFEHLQTITAAERIEAELGALRLIARAARGSMRDALSLTDQAVAFGSGRLDEAGVRQMLGSVDRSHVTRIIEALAQGDGAALVQAVEMLRTLGLSASGALEELAETVQRVAVVQAVGEPAADADDPEAALYARLAGMLAPDEAQLLYSIALHGRAELSLAPDEYGGLLMALLRMLAFMPGADPARRVAPAARGAESRPVSQAAPSKPAPFQSVPAPEPTSIPDSHEAVCSVGGNALNDALDDRWAELVAALSAQGAITALVRELAWQSQCVAVEPMPSGGERWRLRVDRETLRAATHRERLEAAMSAALAHTVELQIEAGAVAGSPAQRDAAHKAERQQAAEQLITADPMVVSMLQQFHSARIVPGSIKPI